MPVALKDPGLLINNHPPMLMQILKQCVRVLCDGQLVVLGNAAQLTY
jgi:Fe-S cluster assembly ATPase SufC